MNVQVNEIFPSIQGEGPVVGYKQLFIRFCNCNLNCKYCDTKFKEGKTYTPDALYDEITTRYNLKTFHSISLTGGEPLMEAEFLLEFLPKIKGITKIYLETNATCFEQLERIIDFVDIISADIKLKSSTGIDTTELHRKFFAKCSGKETFAKIVFDENIKDEEIESCIKLSKEYNIPLILQPKMIDDKMSVTSEFCSRILEKFTSELKDVRLIPQVHKFLNVR